MRFTLPILARAAAVTAASTLYSYASQAHTALAQAAPNRPDARPEPIAQQMLLSFENAEDAALSKMYREVNTLAMAARYEDFTLLRVLLADPDRARYLTEPELVRGYAWTIFVEACASLNVKTVDYLLNNYPLLAENIANDNFVALMEARAVFFMTRGVVQDDPVPKKFEQVVLRLAQIPAALEYMRNSDNFKYMLADILPDNKSRPWFCACT